MRAARRITLVLATVVLMALAACGPRHSGTYPDTRVSMGSYKLVTPGVLTVASDPTFPPFASARKGGGEGFDIDVMRAIGRLMGLKVVVKSRPFGSLAASLNTYASDVVISGRGVEPGRQSSIRFSNPYYQSVLSVAVLKTSDVTTVGALYGKRVGVQSNTEGQVWAMRNLRPQGTEVDTYQDTRHALDALQAGTVDAVVNDAPVLTKAAADGPAHGFLRAIEITPGAEYRIGVAQDNPGLVAAVNGAIGEIKVSGELKKISQTWLRTSLEP